MAVSGGDWRDGCAYAYLIAGDRRCFAWEWLRRSADYVAAWQRGGTGAGAFGLVRFEDPGLTALQARPIWTRSVDRAVLRAEARAAVAPYALDLRKVEGLVSSVPGGHIGEHILISDGLRSIRVDVIVGRLTAGSVQVRWTIDGLLAVEGQLLALRQLASLARTGGFARSLHHPHRRARRWTQMLRVHDALAAGATQREIVAELFGVDVAGPRWRTAAGAWRLQVQRLARGARAALDLGPSEWLGGLDEERE